MGLEKPNQGKHNINYLIHKNKIKVTIMIN